MSLKKWNKLSEKTIYQNSFWTYKLDEFEIEGAGKGEYHYVHTLGSTLIIPFTSNKKFLLVNQFRYLNQMESIEFPCGSISANLTPLQNAQKELREETGMAADKLIYAGHFSPYTGASDELCSVYIGYDLYNSPQPADITEEFEVAEYSYDEVEKLIYQNVIWDGLTIAAWAITKKNILGILYESQ